MPKVECRNPNSECPTPSTFEIRPSAFPTALPGQLFYSNQIPVCRWFREKNKAVEFENDARLFGGEFELSWVA